MQSMIPYFYYLSIMVWLELCFPSSHSRTLAMGPTIWGIGFVTVEKKS